MNGEFTPRREYNYDRSLLLNTSLFKFKVLPKMLLAILFGFPLNRNVSPRPAVLKTSSGSVKCMQIPAIC